MFAGCAGELGAEEGDFWDCGGRGGEVVHWSCGWGWRGMIKTEVVIVDGYKCGNIKCIASESLV